ncbi:MAG: class I SAM-dependent rRNA methyltransferase [Anaerolineae bacterium]
MTNEHTSLLLKKGREKPVRQRHPWIFSGAVSRVQGEPAPGDMVAALSHDGRFLARGYFNPHSQIRCRLLTWTDEPIDEAFWQARIARAAAARTALSLEPETTAYRLINAEADGLPGLVVDRYNEFLVIQCLTMGIERRKEMLVALLAEAFQPAGIVERSDVNARPQEGLPQVTGHLWGTAPPQRVTVKENGLQFAVDVHAGHKTGFYLDQRPNRAIVGRPEHVAGKEILNVFAYTGGFALYAAAAGAGPITNVDASADALTLAEQNMELNEFERPDDEYIVANAFELLRHYRDGGRRFDVAVLDPPKFAHSRRDVDRACRGYKDLNWLAMRLLRPGGLLATFSCSGRISADLFQKVVFSAAVDAGCDVQILQQLGQGPDHPILVTFPESAYLKGLLCRVW